LSQQKHPRAANAEESPRRRDFQENRELILEAADQTFKELGLETPIQQIAVRAGVGIATVYRHFPTRDELVEAAFALRIEEHANVIVEAQRESDHVKAFRETVQAMTRLNAEDLAFNAFIAGIQGNPTKFPGFMVFGTAFLDAFTRAEKHEVWREDVAYADVILLLIGLDEVASQLLAESEVTLTRYVDLALDGICRERLPSSGKPLSGPRLLAVTKR
jgi:AcrR family transcriptional regulator